MEWVKFDAQMLSERIRYVSCAQKDFWRKIPHLALEADGITGFSDQLATAYSAGYWKLPSSVRNGKYTAAVDLDSGKILDADSIFGTTYDTFHGEVHIPPDKLERLASDADVIQLAFHMNELNADKIANSLRNQARQSYPSYYKAHKQIEWRNKMRELYNVKPIFTREVPIIDVTLK